MNLLSTNIYLNCIRLIDYYYGIFIYICITACSTSIFHSIKKALHSLVYTGGWFFYFKTTSSRIIPEVNNIKSIWSLPGCFNLWFRVSESGLRYAHKTPFFSTRQDKNSTLENSPQCEQCPKPDNSRPCKAIFCFIGEYPVGNSSLSLGRLVYCTGLCWSVIALGFYREEGAVFKRKLNF